MAAATAALFVAIQAQNLADVNTAIGNGANVNATDPLNPRNQTPLIASAFYAPVSEATQLSITNALIAAGANATIADDWSMNALMWALNFRVATIAAALIASSPTPAWGTFASVDRFGATALHYAASALDATSIAAILAAGAAIDPLDDRRQTPLMYAAQEPNSDTTVTFLLENGANANLQDNHGKKASSHATGRGNNSAAATLSANALSNTWTIVGSGTLTAANANLTVTLSTLTTYKRLMVSGFIAGYTAVANAGLRFNGITSSTYSYSRSSNGGNATPATGTSMLIAVSTAGTLPQSFDCIIINNATTFKFVTMRTSTQTASAVNLDSVAGVWRNNTNAITSVGLNSGSTTMLMGTTLTVWGSNA